MQGDITLSLFKDAGREYMTAKKEKMNDRLRVEISGSVDANTADSLRSAVMDELDDVTIVVFEMAEMDYISSAGLRVILEVYQTLDERDGKVVLENVREELREIFELTGFSDFMEMKN